MITPATIGRFLIGERRAIESIANGRWVLCLGLIFITVAIVGLLDDQLLFFSDSWLFPGLLINASLFFLFTFAVVKVAGRLRSHFETFTNCGAFLRCFVMTAPLAWLYGIPVEEVMTAHQTALFKVSLYAVITIWQILLMSRVTQVLFEIPPLRAFALIALPASIFTLGESHFQINNLGGVLTTNLSGETRNFLGWAHTTFTTGSLVLCLTSVVMLLVLPKEEAKPWYPRSEKTRIAARSWWWSGLVLALASLAAIVPQQRLRHLATFRQLIEAGRYAEASDFAESMTEEAFPPHHRLLPRSALHDTPFGLQLLAHEQDWPAWLLPKLDRDLSDWLDRSTYYHESKRWWVLYHEVQHAPHVQDVADQFTPGITVSEVFSENDDSD